MRKPSDIFDRGWEWQQLERFVTDPRPEATLGIVSGRRRQGKSVLLDGSLLWSDMEQFGSVATAVAFHGDRAFAAGSAWSKFGPGAITVRAYQR